MHNQSVTQLMKTHRYVRQIAQNELSEFESYPILEAMSNLDLGPCHIDVGKLASIYMEESQNDLRPRPRPLSRRLARGYRSPCPPIPEPQDIVLYGFGRIGRLLARLLVEKTVAASNCACELLWCRRRSRQTSESVTS